MPAPKPLDEPRWSPAPTYELPGRQTEAIRGVVGRVMRTDQVRQQAKLLDVDGVWRELLGEQANQAFVRGLRRGTLHIGVANSALLGELKGFREPELLAALQKRLPARAIRALRFTVQARDEPTEGPPAQEREWE